MEDIIKRDKDGNPKKVRTAELVSSLNKRGYAVIANDMMFQDAFLVKVSGKFIRREHLKTIEDEAKEMVDNDPEDVSCIMDADICSYRFIKHLQKEEVEPFKDPKDECNMFFSNGVLVINRDGTTDFKQADDIYTGTSKIWETTIMKHKYHPNAEWDTGEWCQFCKNVVGEEGLPYLMRAMGYLLHTYKDPKNPKAVILSEYNQDEGGEANGGTGKSLIATKALAVFRNLSTIDGKRWDPKGRFNFQGVSEESDIIALEDVPMGFRYESIYNYISGNAEIERKRRQSVIVPYDKFGKFIITTNYGVALHGDSDRRRRCVIGLQNHYHNGHTPMDDFGHLLFDDWDTSEWDKFFAFMIECVKLYFKKGIANYNNEGIETVAMKRYIGEDIRDYCIDNCDRYMVEEGLTQEKITQMLIDEVPYLGWGTQELVIKFKKAMKSIGLKSVVVKQAKVGYVRVRYYRYEICDENLFRASTSEELPQENKEPQLPLDLEECPF